VGFKSTDRFRTQSKLHKQRKKGKRDVHIKSFFVNDTIRRLALGALLCLGLAAGLVTRAGAQEIEPYEFVPLPAGTNLAIAYYVYGHNTEFNAARGRTFKNSSLEVNIGLARFVHYFEVAGHPAGVQVIQGFGSLSGANVGGQRVGSAFGAQDTTFSAFIWPYVNTASKTNIITAAFINPPIGTYDPQSAINLGGNRWRGTIEVGISQGIGDNFAFDAAFDAQFYGDNNSYVPGNNRLSQDPTYRVQLWANWRWNPQLTTSIGYEGFFGGDQQVNGFVTGNKTELQRIRANAAYFLTPRLQTMLELNHDVKAVGGFKQEFGATLRVVYVF
jgi:hypothetical protein